MRKAVIVDDEKMIRVGIKCAINWKELGISEVFLAAHARDALAIIEDERPELMITDINMPDITGLELIRQARKLVPGLRVIVLTGYDHFEYVRDSLRLEVNDFFLKPVDEEVLVEAIQKQLQSLDETKEKHRSFLKKSTDDYKKAVLGMRKLLKGGGEDAAAQMPDAFRGEKNRKLVLLAAENGFEHEGAELEKYECIDLCNGFLDFLEGEIALIDGSGYIVLLMNRKEDGEELTNRIRQLKSLLLSEMNVKVHVTIGKTFQNMQTIAHRYQEAKQVLQYYQQDQTVRRSEAETKCITRWHRLLAEWIMQIPDAAENLKNALDICGQFEKTAAKEELPSETVEYSGFCLAAGFFYERKNHMLASEKKEAELESFAEMIRGSATEDICMLLKKYMTQLYQENEEKLPDFVAQAKLMIADTFTEDITVNSIAAKLFVTPGYLSRMFKASTGESCNAYIVRKRIEKAKDLLEKTDIPSGKIAGMIGYRDSNYFSLAFKKNTGYSPQQYRQRYTANPEQ